MATNYLGPEAPSPFAVLSEKYSKNYKLPTMPAYERFSFGEPYEEKMAKLIHQYLEVGTDDNVCYVGHTKGSLASMMQDRFCLLQPITSVVPGHIHYEETPNNKMVPVKIAHVGADEFFRDEAKKSPQFDRVLLKDAIDYFTDSKETYNNIMKTLKASGKLLIIQRPANMNTLPLFHDARDHMSNMDQAYMSIIQDLQSLNLDVHWEIECLPIVMPKVKWMKMLQDKFPSHMEGLSSLDVRLGIRELSEGMLKYEGDIVEFQDRLLFISATLQGIPTYPCIQRFGAHALRPFPGMENLKYHMQVTPDIQQVLDQKQKMQEHQPKGSNTHFNVVSHTNGRGLSCPSRCPERISLG